VGFAGGRAVPQRFQEISVQKIFWRTVEELQQEGYILGAKEIAATRKTASVQFQINPEKLALGPG
jgi:hypothetical protein